MRPDDPLTEGIIGACIEVHRVLGPGLLESAYEEAVCYELAALGLRFARQTSMPIRYKEFVLASDFRIDLLVEDRIVVELKAVDALSSIHVAQLITYLKVANREVGLLVNFNVAKLTQGLRRVTHKKNSSGSRPPVSL
jgi:GxxExxY protein